MAVTDSSPVRTFTIDRRNNLSYQDFVEEYLKPQRPVVITDGIKEWPALKRWTPQFFKTNFGEKQVKDGTGQVLRFADYIDLVLSSTNEKPCPYLSGLMIRQQFPEIASDILPELKYCLPDRFRSRLMIGKIRSKDGIPELLISGLGGRFKLHYDALHALGFVNQIYGDKEFIVFPPSESRYLYQSAHDQRHSDLNDPFEPDLKKFPLFSQALQCRFVLGPGETIFNPAGWWHATRMLTPSVAVVISTVNGANWRDFSADIGRNRAGVPMLVTAALRAYLAVAGALLTAKERMFFHMIE